MPLKQNYDIGVFSWPVRNISMPNMQTILEYTHMARAAISLDTFLQPLIYDSFNPCTPDSTIAVKLSPRAV